MFVSVGCSLSADNPTEITRHKGGSVLFPCSCSDLHTKPQKFTWWSDRTGRLTEMLNDEHYRGRLQLFNHSSPGNLSLLISDLREEDQGVYRCSTEKEHRDIRLYVKGCSLSADNPTEITGHKGGSVLFPCSCSDLHTKPQKFTWRTFRTGRLTEVLNDEHYRGRLQLFNHSSPANLSLFISDLREEDRGSYRCSTEKDHRDIRLYVKVGRRETSTHSRKTDTTRPSEPPQSTTTNSPPASSSTTLEQDKQQTHSSLPLVFGILAGLLLVIPGVVAFICWKRKGGRCGENVITEGRPDCKRKQKDQTEPGVTYSTVTHMNTAGAARVQINTGDKTEYASILTN
ncbi:polymeric immunoglobulin receptor-like isoform X1 [Ictalurus furcatus]|uniref:polymeric immunoglobulin receptor-like isoform X1 n=1 Tax=Ictalurus furcatus TaxID=66913 RepID=UPI002350E19E|nr:polymeric immunoglobulin receptor-like isoform X1 [Ictalurus furcatus]